MDAQKKPAASQRASGALSVPPSWERCACLDTRETDLLQ